MVRVYVVTALALCMCVMFPGLVSGSGDLVQYR